VLVDTDTRRCHNRCGGGCGDALASCESDAQCCDLSCMPQPITLERVCLSPPGGPCRQDRDCASCHVIDCTMGSVCDTTAGVCRCPDGFACCSTTDCDTAERCQTDPSGLYGECVPLDVGE
jgi:hypothetical protein